MNIKKLLSSLLVLVMLVGIVVGLVPPVSVEAAHSPSVGSDDNYTNDRVKEIVEESYKYEFSTTAEMLAYELSKGYLDSATAKGGKYTIYVNRYVGTLYYVNNATGQILCSNPSDPAKTNMSDDVRRELMSQIIIYYTKNNGSVSGQTTYLSSKWAAEYSQINVSAIDSGLRVTYVFGDTVTRYIVPGQITAENFYEYILNPLLDTYLGLLEEHIREYYPEEVLDFYGRETWGSRKRATWEYGEVGTRALQEYVDEMRSLCKTLRDSGKMSSALYTELYQFSGKILNLVGASGFSIKNPKQYDESTKAGQEQLKAMNELCPLTKEGTAVYVRNLANTTDNAGSLRKLQNLILQNTYYSKELLEEHEAECGYSEPIAESFVFRCSIEYSFNEDGTLSVRLPSNSVTYDDLTYYVSDIAILPFFGAGNLRDDGYLFIPDGSGAIVEYEDFYNSNFKQNLSISLKVYGDDYVYTSPSGYHKESVNMPVFGVVSTEKATALTKQYSAQESYKTGYLAIIEEGESLSTLRFQFGGTRHYYTSSFASISLYPSDVYDLTDTITVSGVSSYRRVSQSRFTGSLLIRYAMLGDETLSMSAGESFYPATYVGMASYYRDYLKERGDISALETVTDDLPLYVEALGSMNIVEKFLTFPVTVSRPLTTFEDIITMYNEFARAEEKLLEKANEYYELAEAETKNAVLRAKYEAKAAEYKKLSEELSSVTNINFKLTGFANGGMYFTYPSSVRWESACGGDAGLTALINATKSVDGDANFSIFPEFDFLYKSNSALFDGTDNNRDIARMLDDRFASKQEYNSVLAMYESLFSLVVSTDSLDRFYTSFAKSYKNYGINGLSLSTLGSDLNSNINVDNFISREESKNNVIAMLDRAANEDGYSVMVMNGNSYTWRYADHILDINTDSSHLAYTSYTIPFTGLVLHSYVNYTGSALNYTGSPDYDILRSIENGASLYYILCYQNTNHMKEDAVLNKYYGVDYENWYDDVVARYNELNSQIGNLQSYEIVDHRTVIAERVIDEKETAVNNAKLKAEFIELVKSQTLARVNDAFDSIFDDPSYIGVGVSVDIDVDSLIEQASVALNIDKNDLIGSDFEDALKAIKAEYNAEYPEKSGAVKVCVETVEYETQYKYVTYSYADDEDYVYTDYTVDNDRVVVVTYRHPTTGATSIFILNYNVYAVTVSIEGMQSVTLDRYGYKRIDL